MKLSVRVIEARNLPAMDLNGFSDPYVRLQLGRQRSKTKVVKKSLNPCWGEEFSFRVEDLNEELLVSVLDEDKYFNDDFVGQVRVPVNRVLDADNKSLDTAWYPLQPKNKKSKVKDCGEILLGIQFSQSNSFAELNSTNRNHVDPLRKDADLGSESPLRSFGAASSNTSSPGGALEDFATSKDEKLGVQKTIAGRIAQMFNKNADAASSNATCSSSSTTSRDLGEISELVESEANRGKSEDDESTSGGGNFEDLMKRMESGDQESEMPANLPGGVLIDRMYAVATPELNSLLFATGSSFLKSLAELQGSTELQVGPWRFDSTSGSAKRTVSCIKAATKLIRAVKATEEHKYLKADGKSFAVLSIVSTPDVMYGSTFKTEVLYCITAGPELASGEQTSHLVISWRTNFLQSTMMKGMIEGGTRQGLRDSYEFYSTLLAQTVKPVDLKDFGSNKEQALASLQAEPESDFKLAIQYFANFTVASSILVGLYVLVHVWLATPNSIQGLEFVGLDLPDSIGELVVSGLLVLQAQRVLGFISRFMKARAQKGSDHGVKAQGNGWLITVALIEGSNLAAVDATGFSDPYVVFTCNGKTKTSSIKFQKLNPNWNEIFEFDAMDEPPSVLDVEVFDFDGPFDDATSLGRAEINFVRTNISDLADFWIPLQGKLAQPCQSKIHLRIFLDNTKGGNAVEAYLSRMEKEVGKKINVRSPQTNSAFQKLFGLTSEEFLINDFTCHLKRKMPLQGRLFLSPRIIGFHANLFGHKTKFSFLWEDIEDIQILTPSLVSMGSPVMVMTLWKGRGKDAKHGARIQDSEGRLKFHFQSFVSFGVANKTIMALWKARSLTPEQKVRIIEEESEAKSTSLQTEESGAFLGLDDVTLSEVYSSVFSAPTNFFMELFGGSDLERKVMEKAGCLEYSYTPWESEKGDVFERQTCYKFDKRISRYGGESRCSQQKSPLSDRNGWTVEEVMTLEGVPLGDYFNLHIRYQVEDLPSKSKGCQVKVHFGIAWLKGTRHQKRITKNILENLQGRLKVIFCAIDKEFATR